MALMIPVTLLLVGRVYQLYRELSRQAVIQKEMLKTMEEMSKEIKVAIGGLVADTIKLESKASAIEAKITKYEEAATKITKLHSISPRLARGAQRL